MQAQPFPRSSIRAAVARLGDNWTLHFEDPAGERRNEHMTAEIRDASIMARCWIGRDRGTELDPRVWIGVPLVDRIRILRPQHTFPAGSIRRSVADHGDRWARHDVGRFLQVVPCEAADWDAMACRRHTYLGAEVTA